MDAQDEEPETPAAPKRRGRPPKVAEAAPVTTEAPAPQAAPALATMTIRALRKVHVDPADVVGHPLGQVAMSIKLDPDDPERTTLRNVKALVAERLIASGAARAV